MALSYSKVYLRADGGVEIGLGHLYRCYNLGMALRKRFECVFLCESMPEEFAKMVRATGIEVRSAEADGGGICGQIVVLDGYGFREDEMRRWSERGNYVVHIDDLNELYFDCDMVISHGPQNRPQDYRARPGCRLLVGPEYAMIAPQFYSRSRTFSETVDSVFVGFGGSDAGNVTAYVLDRIYSPSIHFSVVVGMAYEHGDTLALYAAKPNVEILSNVGQARLAEVLSRCDCAIVGGGTQSLEVCASGVPALCLAVADNQVRVCEKYEEKGMAKCAGVYGVVADGELEDRWRRFVGDSGQRRAIIETNRRIFERPGSDRIADILRSVVDERRGLDEPRER